MDGGHELFGVSRETAQVIGGAAVAAGGYGYFTKARGWRFALGVLTSFGGGAMFFEAGTSFIALFTDKPMPAVASGVAGTLTLGVIWALREGARRLDLLEWFGRKA